MRTVYQIIVEDFAYNEVHTVGDIFTHPEDAKRALLGLIEETIEWSAIENLKFSIKEKPVFDSFKEYADKRAEEQES